MRPGDRKASRGSQLEDLEQRACSGEAAAFGQLIRSFDKDLRGVVWAVVRRDQDIDDVMQAAYEKAFRSIHGFNRKSSFKTWLHSICYKTALDHVRYEGRRQHGEIAETDKSKLDISTSSDVLTRLDIDHVFSQLNPEQRALIMLTSAMGYSFEDVAEIVNMPRGTVASKISRARSKLGKGD